MAGSAKKKKLSDEILELFKEESSGDDDSDDGNELPRVENFNSDEYELPDARSSEFRKRNIKLLSEESERYKGKVSSRKELDIDEQNSSDAVTTSSEDDTDENKSSDDELDDETENDDTEINPDAEDKSKSSDEDKYELDAITEQKDSNVKKGESVRNQLRLWEKCLELRIQTNKILTKSNQLPYLGDLLTEPAENEKADLIHAARSCAKDTSTLLQSLIELQNLLRKQSPELKLLEEDPLNSNDINTQTIKQYGAHLGKRFDLFRPHLNKTLLKWDDRTKLLTPNVGIKQKHLLKESNILLKIESTLSNRSDLIQKSQTAVKNTLQVEGNTETDCSIKTNAEIYDDSDFYHHQLREMIEYKTSISSNATEAAAQLVQLQKLRKKIKKNVDSRASKGRKIRYVVHKKLVNFMAPYNNTTWTPASKDELYKSLFAS